MNIKTWQERLKQIKGMIYTQDKGDAMQSEIDELRTELQRLAEQEPVGWFNLDGDVWHQYYEDYPEPNHLRPLYAAAGAKE